MTDNLRIWNAVQATDPKHTKKVEFGRKFTSIDAHWQIMRATEQFGPIGEGWGYSVEHSTLTLTPEIILAVADVLIWWGSPPDDFNPGPRSNGYGPIRATCEMYGPKTYKGKIIPGEFVTDEDAPKKAMTDALTKGLSHLGFSADVFLGLFDDNRYVQKMEKEFAKDADADIQRLAGKDAARDPETGELLSNYRVNKAKKEQQAISLVKDTAKLAIGMCQSRVELKGWIKDNKAELAEKLSTPDYDAVIDMVDARWDELPEPEKVA